MTGGGKGFPLLSFPYPCLDFQNGEVKEIREMSFTTERARESLTHKINHYDPEAELKVSDITDWEQDKNILFLIQAVPLEEVKSTLALTYIATGDPDTSLKKLKSQCQDRHAIQFYKGIEEWVRELSQ